MQLQTDLGSQASDTFHSCFITYFEYSIDYSLNRGENLKILLS